MKNVWRPTHSRDSQILRLSPNVNDEKGNKFSKNVKKVPCNIFIICKNKGYHSTKQPITGTKVYQHLQESFWQETIANVTKKKSRMIPRTKITTR